MYILFTDEGQTCRNVSEELPVISVPLYAVEGVNGGYMVITSKRDVMTNFCPQEPMVTISQDCHT